MWQISRRLIKSLGVKNIGMHQVILEIILKTDQVY